jgi:hypothetical protein
MTGTRFEVTIDRVVLLGPSVSPAQGQRLRELVEHEIRERAATRRETLNSYSGDRVEVEMSHLSLDTPEGERRVARYMADAVMDSLKGKNK